MKQEIRSYLSKRSGQNSQGKKSNGSSVASSLIKRTAIAASTARLKTELKFADPEAQKTSALKEYEDERKKFKLEKELALAKAEMEAVIKTEDKESENFVEDKNLPKEIDKDYVLQNYLKTQAASVTSGSNSTVETNLETMERSCEELLSEKGIPSVKDAPFSPPLEANPADEKTVSRWSILPSHLIRSHLRPETVRMRVTNHTILKTTSHTDRDETKKPNKSVTRPTIQP